jgi:hypothetical protein
MSDHRLRFYGFAPPLSSAAAIAAHAARLYRNKDWDLGNTAGEHLAITASMVLGKWFVCRSFVDGDSRSQREPLCAVARRANVSLMKRDSDVESMRGRR